MIRLTIDIATGHNADDKTTGVFVEISGASNNPTVDEAAKANLLKNLLTAFLNLEAKHCADKADCIQGDIPKEMMEAFCKRHGVPTFEERSDKLKS